MTPVAGQQFEYTFDDVGDRTSTKASGDSAEMKVNYRSRCSGIHLEAIRIVLVLSLGVTAGLLCSCTSPERTLSQGGSLAIEEPVTYPAGMDAALSNRISQIHVGMTFEEVAQLTQIYTNGLQLVEHGGIWFHSPAGTNWIVELRFENPSKQPDILKRKLNLSPVIRARIPNEASW